MATVTLRHKRGDALVLTVDQALKAWDGVVRNRPWRRIRERFGVVGYVRAVEVTWGQENGWHPHIHALLFVVGQLDPDDLAYLQAELFVAWQHEVIKQGGRGLSLQHGVKITRAGSAAYIAKVQEHDRVVRAGLEMTRFDLKGGRHGSLTPFELLDSPNLRGLWLEYVAATKGRRAITWDRKLRALLELGRFIDDQEVINDSESSDLIGLLPASDYDQIRNDPAVLAEVLEIVEDECSKNRRVSNRQGSNSAVSAPQRPRTGVPTQV